MKKIIITSLVLAGLTFGLSAQSSSIYKGSSGTFKTFTDTYMDEQNFNKITYPKNFGFVSAETGYPTAIDLGYAHNYNGKVQLGLYSTSSFGSDFTINKVGKSKYKAQFNSINSKLLLGFKNHAFSVSYGGFMNEKQNNEHLGTEPTEYGEIEHFKLTDDSYNDTITTINWGGNFELSKLNLKPIVSFDYVLFSKRDYNKDDNLDKTIRGSIIGGALGSDFEFKSNNSFHHEAGVKLSIGYKSTEITGKMKNEEGVDISVITPLESISGDLYTKYHLTYSMDDKILLSLKTSLTTSLSNNITKTPTDYTNSLPSKIESKEMLVSLKPDLNFGCLFNIKPEVLSLALGANIEIPSINFGNTKDSKDKKLGSSFSFGTLSTDFNVGINWNFNKYVSADASLNIPVSPELAKSFIGSAKFGITFRK